MERSLRPIEPFVHLTQEATLDALGHTLARSRLEAVLKAVGVMEQRARKLTLVLAVMVCIAMNLFTEEAIDDVLVKLLQGPRFLRPDDDVEVASASAICQRRQQLGVAPMVAVFREVCHPLATLDTRDAFLFGLRLMAIDGTTEDVADTPANAKYFGRQHGSRGDSASPKCGPFTCVNVAHTPSAMLVSGPTTPPSVWGVCGCSVRWTPGCWSCGIVVFIVLICAPAVCDNAKPSFWGVCPRMFG